MGWSQPLGKKRMEIVLKNGGGRAGKSVLLQYEIKLKASQLGSSMSASNVEIKAIFQESCQSCPVAFGLQIQLRSAHTTAHSNLSHASTQLTPKHPPPHSPHQQAHPMDISQQAATAAAPQLLREGGGGLQGSPGYSFQLCMMINSGTSNKHKITLLQISTKKLRSPPGCVAVALLEWP